MTHSENANRVTDIAEYRRRHDETRHLEPTAVRWLLTGQGEAPAEATQEGEPIQLDIPGVIADAIRGAAARLDLSPEDYVVAGIVRNLAMSDLETDGYEPACVRSRAPLRVGFLVYPQPPEIIRFLPYNSSSDSSD